MAVDAFKLLSVAREGPNGSTPGWTDKNVAAGPVPFAFVAVIVNWCSVPFVRPLTVRVVAGAGIWILREIEAHARV